MIGHIPYSQTVDSIKPSKGSGEKVSAGVRGYKKIWHHDHVQYIYKRGHHMSKRQCVDQVYDTAEVRGRHE